MSGYYANLRRRRAELAQEVLRLREAGLTHKQIGERLGIPWKKSSALANDPDGSKLRERHERMGGTCEVCGKRTSWTVNGPARLCIQHAQAQATRDRRWTAELVIDAIQRFAAVHGRAPIADEWITADPVNDYPPRSSVYGRDRPKSSGNPAAPFATWADAIEAAGFPRPTTGRRVRSAMTQKNLGYVIFHEREDGLWELVGTEQVHSQIIALNNALNGHEPRAEERWVAVPGRYWEPRTLKPTTVYEFVSEDAPQ